MKVPLHGYKIIFFSLIIFFSSLATCYSGEADLSWDANVESDLAGYKVYYKTGSSGAPYDGTGALEGNSPVDIGARAAVSGSVTYTLTGLTDGVQYCFVVTAYDDGGLESGYSNEVCFVVDSGSNQAPNGVINTPSSNAIITAGQAVSFSGTGTDSDGNTPLTYLWNFGGGATNSTSEDPGNVIFNTVGSYIVSFTVTDSLGLSDSTPDSVTITVNAPANQAPDGVIDSPSSNVTISEGDTVNFSGTGSDPDRNTPLTFLWNFDGGATNSTSEDPGNVTFNTAGTYTVTFTVTDSLGAVDASPASVTITVSANQAPNGVIDSPSSNVTISEGDTVNFSGTGSDPDGNTPLTYQWDFNGGASNSTSEDPGNVTFDTAGTYTVTFTVTDSFGLADSTPATVQITVNSSSAVTLYMPDDCANLQACFQAMTPNSTLIIRDGVYTGTLNTIHHDSGKFPPSGSGNSSDSNNGYTIIKAENDGQVTFDGQKTEQLFYLDSGTHQYLEFRGMKFINPSNVAAKGDAIGIYENSSSSYIKFIRVGANVNDPNGAASGFEINNGSYILIEESYVWGDGANAILVKGSDHIVVRRSVARLDASNGGGDTISLFNSFNSQYMEWQNNIVIDSNYSYYSNYSSLGSAFDTHQGVRLNYTEDNQFRGNIVLNLRHWDASQIGAGYKISNDGNASLPHQFENNVAWDVPAGVERLGNVDVSIPTMKNSTIYVPRGAIDVNDVGTGVNHTNLAITDSLFIGGDYAGINGGASSNYNVLWNTADDFNSDSGSSAGPNDFTVDNGNAFDPMYNTNTNPSGGLKYITRIEQGSNLSAISSTGSSIGATVLKQYGISGTLWGESGYNTITNDDLWPFPYESQIRADFRTYNPGGSDAAKPDGQRGFAADGWTLTSYIWNYIGFPTFVQNVTATPGNDEITVSWNTNATNENIDHYLVYYGTVSGVYDGAGSPINAGNVGNFSVTGLTGGTTYYFTVAAVDSNGDEGGIYNNEVSAAPLSSVVTITTPGDGFNVNSSNYTSFTVSGTAEASAGVEVFSGATSLGTTTADGNGDWTINVNFSSVSEGSVSLSAVSNSVTSNTINGTYDKTAPGPPSLSSIKSRQVKSG